MVGVDTLTVVALVADDYPIKLGTGQTVGLGVCLAVGETSPALPPNSRVAAVVFRIELDAVRHDSMYLPAGPSRISSAFGDFGLPSISSLFLVRPTKRRASKPGSFFAPMVMMKSAAPCLPVLLSFSMESVGYASPSPSALICEVAMIGHSNRTASSRAHWYIPSRSWSVR